MMALTMMMTPTRSIIMGVDDDDNDNDDADGDYGGDVEDRG